MSLSPVVANNEAQAADLNQYRDHLQGDVNSTESWHLRSASGSDFIVTLADAAGARKFSVKDSGGVEVASVNSDGAIAATKITSDNTELDIVSEVVTTAASSTATYTVNLNDGTVHDVTLSANCTFTFSNPVAAGRASSFTLILRQDATGSRTATWPASVDWPAATAPTLTTTAAAVDAITFFTVDGGTTWFGQVAGQAYG